MAFSRKWTAVPSRVPVSMIKSELVQRIAEHNPHLYQRDVENIVNAILDEIVAALARGDRVELRGFGAFSVKHRPARAGRNARTSEPRKRGIGRRRVGVLNRAYSDLRQRESWSCASFSPPWS